MDAPNIAIAVFFLVVTFVALSALVGALRDLARISDDLRSEDLRTRAEDEAKADDDQVIDFDIERRRRGKR
jgi:hypothetical protein